MSNAELACLVASDTTGATMGEAEPRALPPDEDWMYPSGSSLAAIRDFAEALVDLYDQAAKPLQAFAKSFNAWLDGAQPIAHGENRAQVLDYPLAFSPDNVREMG